jgi:histidyl-tRNA synthetase
MSKKDKQKKEGHHLETICDKVGEIAVHYGFNVIKPPEITHEDSSKAKQFKDFDYYGDIEEKVALTRWYMDHRLDLESQPVAIHYKKPLKGQTLKKKPNTEVYGFEIMGSGKSTSEALLLKCVLAVLEEVGYSNLFVDVNSIGDRESIVRFERELNNYFRKNSSTLPAKIKQEFKKNHYSIFSSGAPEIKEFIQNAPQTVASLSDVSRAHFKEVLESIEIFGTDYKIKPNLLSNKLYASYTVFEIRQISDKKEEDGELLAYGYRYNHLAKKIGGKREIPTVGATIIIKKNPIINKKIIIKNIKKPKFYLIQLGSTAKLKALNVVEMLRKNRISVYHSITKDKITSQLNGAEYVKASHVLIMGQKEAIENSMVVRNVVNREQETVPISELGSFLKGLGETKKKA